MAHVARKLHPVNLIDKFKTITTWWWWCIISFSIHLIRRWWIVGNWGSVNILILCDKKQIRDLKNTLCVVCVSVLTVYLAPVLWIITSKSNFERFMCCDLMSLITKRQFFRQTLYPLLSPLYKKNSTNYFQHKGI